MRRLKVYTTSELKCARACLRQHRYRYVDLRRPHTRSEALRFGTLWHTGLEVYSTAGIEQALRELDQRADDVDAFARVVVEELLVGYAIRWEEDGLTAVSVEQKFEFELDDVLLGGRLDAVVRDRDGRLHVMEHKTTASDIEAGSLYWERVRTLDTQVSLYIRGARALGHAVEDCIYDVVRKPTIRPLKATPEESRKYTKATAKEPSRLYANMRETDETPEEYRLRIRADIAERPDWYYARGTVVRLEAEERAFARDVEQQVAVLGFAIERSYAPHNPDACSAFGGCEYLPVCTGAANINDDTLFRTAVTAHEELAET